IDFQPTSGVLYGISVDGLLTSRLATLDKTTGLATSINTLGLIDARAMAFDSAGVLYVAGHTSTTSTTDSLYIVNPATAAKTAVGPIGFFLAGIDFAPDGTLYGIVLRNFNITGSPNGGLVRLSKTTGAGTLLFTTGRQNQAGIRFAPPIAVDHDLDGIHDIADCAPLDPTNSAPGIASGLIFTDAARGVFTWTPAPNARFHNSYRGTITGSLGQRPPGAVFDQVCFESGDAQGNGDLVSADPSSPAIGTAWYYVTDGEGCGEGPLDSDPAHPIPNSSPCPTPP
ncbi:MAG TPA: hypothetical protein VFT43_09675, partial [Candidatus Polarisedimenticolia bacterium]|nr:hypothetical protein [Candidatus Polarisedimenticolia bacterium]